ncbi:MAG TPA: TrkA family potassium uptake protein [Candidatus Kapabacteria bacterium]|nr:TrkA family potassium uptake protein [Candidatus Kapabacteria bacterium]
MKNNKFCVIGLGYFGFDLALYLTERGAEVIAIDNKEERIELLKDRVAVPVVADSTDMKALKKLGVEDMDAVIVAIGEGFEASINTLYNLQELGVKKIFARVISPIHEKLIKLMDIDEILLPESEAAKHLANRLILPGLIDFIELDQHFGIFETAAPAHFIGQTLTHIDLRKNYNLNLVTIKSDFKKGFFGKHEYGNIVGIPNPEYVFNDKDILVLFGLNEDIEKFLQGKKRN